MKKIIILTIFLILLTNNIYAIGGFDLTTSLNKEDYLGQISGQRIRYIPYPAKYSGGDELVWYYKLKNNGPNLNATVCFFLKKSNGTLYDITQFIEDKANLQYYNCTKNEGNNCPINLSNILISNTNSQFVSGTILTYSFPDNFPQDKYSLITQLRKAKVQCSNQINNGELLTESVNLINFTGPGLSDGCIVMQDNTPRNYKLKIVIIGDKYGPSNQDLFLQDTMAIKEQVLKFMPFKENKDKINFYAINPEEDLGCTFNCYNITRLICCDNSKLMRAVLSKCPFNEVIAVVNNESYGGSGLPTTTTTRRGIFFNVPIHEFGHSFGGLVDEYSADGADIPYYPEDVNCDNNTQCLKWQNLTGIGGIGCFEGCKYRRYGLYRPIEVNSIMLDQNGDFGPVNERHLRRLLERYR
ncbi:hypothetical protein HYX19_00720 [Candidatus Woesearchaeota archaeon]|nr:hypothetical protein [Candidatus Woesearchaeota archaeon]